MIFRDLKCVSRRELVKLRGDRAKVNVAKMSNEFIDATFRCERIFKLWWISQQTVVITNVSSALTKRDYTCYFALLKKN